MVFGLRGVAGSPPLATRSTVEGQEVQRALDDPASLWPAWLAIALVSVLGAVLVFVLMESVAIRLRKAGLVGRDINKKKTKSQPLVPESAGIVPGLVYIICVVCLQPRLLLGSILGTDVPGMGTEMIENSPAASYYGVALVAVLLGLFCGFLDDVLDLRWSQKILLSFAAVTPLVVAYAGPTWIVVPKPFRHNTILSYFVDLGDAAEVTAARAYGISLVDLGVLYLVYLLLYSVFCTNAINIHAGINGLEVGQSIVLAVAFLIHCVLQIVHNPTADPTTTVLPIALLAPFITTSLALWWFNFFPSRVFVGDSYTYWAGMTLAVVGIVSHGSKTMMLFFIPQLLNFAYSLPQILGVFGPCPRHRLPRYDAKKDVLVSIPSNHNIINLTLWVTGPLHERTLVLVVLAFHICCILVSFYIRYVLAGYFYDQ
jgi:UDP-N-acetylglucosamine--dolichyl-phosphate N-acetylglucosaminephosphotransferase